MARILVTGAAGFIGYHVAARLLARGDAVVGIDSLDPYYDVALKRARLDRLPGGDFTFVEGDIAERSTVRGAAAGCDAIIHLAAQAGVRHSLSHPEAYTHANITGTMEVLEAARLEGVAHVVFASSSSVYGTNTTFPAREQDPVDHPVSLYAATKRAGELMCHTHAHLYALPCTALRLFTVYGPWGRPDMALFKFTRAILAGEPLPLYNHGDMARDFTYVDDVVDAILAVLARPPASSTSDRPDRAEAPFRIYNVGHTSPVPLLDFVAAIERATGLTATRALLPMQPGDVARTWASCDALVADTGYRPSTPVDTGVAAFVAWYRDHYGV